MDDPKYPLPELFYLELRLEPLGFQATIPLPGGEQKRFHFPLTGEGAVELIMRLLADKSIANEVWPRVMAILEEAMRQNALEEVEYLKPAEEGQR